MFRGLSESPSGETLVPALKTIAEAVRQASVAPPELPKDRPLTSEPRYAEAIQRWEAFWSLEDIDRPLWFLPSEPVITASYLTQLLRQWDVPTLLKDRSTMLEASLMVLRWREATDYGDDFIPRLIPQQGTTAFASAFGCEVEFFKHTFPWAHPLIRPEDPPEKVYDLPAPAVTDGQLGDILDLCDFFREQTGIRYPIAVTDMQGPLDTAYLVWEPQSFMLAMYSNPREVHHLMRLVTDLIIKFAKEQKRRCGEFIPCHYPPLWLRHDQGLLISDDCLAVLNPGFYEEFALPYVNQLSEEFGGIYLHSCGDFKHQLDNLANVRNLRGINFGASEMPFEALWERFGGKTCLIPHFGLNVPMVFDSNADFVSHVARVAGKRPRGLCLVLAPTESPDGADLDAFASEMHQLLELFR